MSLHPSKSPYIPLGFTLGLPTVEDWPKLNGDVPWVLDPAEHPRPAVQSHHKSAGPSSGDERRRRRKKKHHWPKKQELKVTTCGQGDDAPIWTHTESNLSSSSESQTEGDSGVGSYRKLQGGTGATTRHDYTPQYSLETIRKLDEGDLKDAPLSDHSGNSGHITDVNGVTPHGFTVIGKPQEESSPVYNFLLTNTVILHYVGRYPIRHMGH